MTWDNILIILFAIIVLGYLYSKRENLDFLTPTLTTSCNSKTDISCRLYNHLDTTSKCKALCSNNHPGTIFNGTHTFNKETDDHICECILPEHFTTDFSPVNTSEVIIDPKLLLDEPTRDTRDKQFEKRYQDLVFGI